MIRGDKSKCKLAIIKNLSENMISMESRVRTYPNRGIKLKRTEVDEAFSGPNNHSPSPSLTLPSSNGSRTPCKIERRCPWVDHYVKQLKLEFIVV